MKADLSFILHPSSFILRSFPVTDSGEDNDRTLRGFASYLRSLPMPELRKDPIVGRWVIIATDRAKRPVAPIDLTAKLCCPLLGLFGNDDENPNRDQVNRTEAVLKKLGKTYEFYRYDGAGHAFFNAARPAYRPEQALDGWNKVFSFFHKHLAAAAAARAA